MNLNRYETLNHLSTFSHTKIMAFSTDRSGATGVQLTGDELRFQHFSAPTHPTGYVWEEKQVKCKVKNTQEKCPNDTCEVV